MIKIIEIKGKKETLIRTNGIWVYKYRRCGCPCNERITFKKSQIKNGVPKFVATHQTKTLSFKKKMSKRVSGSKNPMFGKTGKDCPNFGKHISEEQKEILRNVMSGENNHQFGKTGKDSPNFGKHPSKKSRNKMRKSQLGENNHNFGVSFSEETINKMSKARKKYHQEHPGVCHWCGHPPQSFGYGKGDYYNSPLQGRIWMRSTYELAYAKYLDSRRILWKYEHKTFSLSNGTSYTPDFFLVKNKKYREIKGYMRPDARIKIKLFRKEYPNKNFKVLYKEDLVRKGIL